MPLILQEKWLEDADVGVWKIDEDESFYLAGLILSDWEKQYIGSIREPGRRLRWLASRFLLKQMMKTDAFVELLFNDYGKPYISNFPLFLSLSHCSEYAAVILSGNNEVGIDIEETGRDISALGGKFLSDTEIAQLSPEERKRQLLLYWGAKEVMYKIYGKRKLAFREDLFVKSFVLENRGAISGMLMKEGLVREFNMEYMQRKHFSIVAGEALRTG